MRARVASLCVCVCVWLCPKQDNTCLTRPSVWSVRPPHNIFFFVVVVVASSILNRILESEINGEEDQERSMGFDGEK